MSNPVSQGDSKNKRLVITGAGGFVGPFLIKAVLKRYGSNCAIMACTHGADRLCIDDKRVLFGQPDITDRLQIEQLVKEFRPTDIVHLAAISHVPTAAKNPSLVWDVNVTGTLNLLEVVRHHAPEAAVLFVSSSEIYGRSFQSGKSLDESAELQPRNPYATTKAAGDLLVGQYAEFGLKVIRARPFNHIGPGQSADFVVSAFAAQIAKIEKGLQAPELMVGNLDAARDFLDVRDVVRAYLDLLDGIADIKNGDSFNICSGRTRLIREVLDNLIELSTVEFEIVSDEARMRPSDTPMAAGSASKLRDLTGWEPQHQWMETLEDVLENWRVTLSP